MRFRSMLLLTALLGAALAQPLPPGLQQKGGVIMMQPIADSDQPVAPIERRVGAIHVLSTTDHDLFSKAFDAADRGDWPSALALADRGQNAMARKLLQWRYLQDKMAKPPTDQIDAFLRANPDWPRRNSLLARAEENLDPAMTPQAVIAWFGGRNPISALGEIRLGEAYVATGKAAWGAKLIRDGWVAGSFEPEQELAIVEKDGVHLTPDTERRRLDNLIWKDQITAAKREMARVDDTTQRLGAARIALRTQPQQWRNTISALSADLISDPWLAFDKARAARRAGDNTQAEALLLRAPFRELIKTHTASVWAELNVDARQALQDGNPHMAYELVHDTGLTSGNEFSEAQFLAGWIALRYLKDPSGALDHFKKLVANVSRPISLARGHYWQGRAYEDMGDTANAWAQYRAAATMSDTFYGQLALARIDANPTLRVKSTPADPVPHDVFEHDDLVRAMRVLADLGSQDLLRAFALRYQELHPEPGAAKELAGALTDMGFRDVAVRVAKIAGYDGVSFPAYAFPVIAVPPYHGPGAAPEVPLVLSIIRQETEFDVASISGAGARGIMQVMPSAARRNSRLAGIAYRPNALTTDADYNMQLGMTEFAGYMSDWNGSIVLSAASYNAGENNARKWVAAFGDPRSPNVNPIDWIEEIPFSETRNYVERVIENLEVYRARVAGHEVPLKILADLYAPAPPPSKVLAYVPPAASVPLPAPKPAHSETATDDK
ncbi:MAG: transglycosylase SLT domain-containing protein [Alphaproteobacteria bacterium]|nr:transglycosylase SLT domain-containing protein [Alphaproteobacteria bacterium]